MFWHFYVRLAYGPVFDQELFRIANRDVSLAFFSLILNPVTGLVDFNSCLSPDSRRRVFLFEQQRVKAALVR